MTMFVDIPALREYLSFNDSATSKYSDETLGSNLRSASAFLERRTSRWFADRPSTTWTLTTNGQATLALPGFRTISGVTIAGSALASEQTYWAIPDAQQTGVYTGIALRAFRSAMGSDWYKAVPEWFDRNLDSPRYAASGYYASSIPNDLVITGDGGYLVEDYPEELLIATKALAGYLTRRPDALLSNASITPEGNVFDYSKLPIEVATFIESWRVGTEVVGI